MAYDFKRLSDVEVVAEPTESANVLIEENGIIKKTPKTAVGGGETDLVIVISENPKTKITESTLSIVEGSIESVCNAIREGRTPNVKFRFCKNMDKLGEWYYISATEVQAQVYVYGEYLIFRFYIAENYNSSRLFVHTLHMTLDGAFYNSTLHSIALTEVEA